ncbi:MAG: type VI secretion system tip protein VgrG, partial [Deltaproteobacteria bacterium]|nr:type VI secretion system tip protein VgrG [Deltaproteobacteria bacterium]
RAGARRWTGICSSIEQEQIEPAGQSTYLVRLVPDLWLLTKRTTQRIFQRLSIPDIVSTVLHEWRVPHGWDIEPGAYPKLDYRVQYAESDFDFVSRLLEEAGIAYYFLEPEAGQELAPGELFTGEGTTELVLSDRVHANPRRAGPPLPFVLCPGQAAELEYVSQVSLAQEVRPGRLSIRDFDFRLRPDYELACRAEVPSGAERAYEQYQYRPGAFQVVAEGGGNTPVGDDKAAVRTSESHGAERVRRALASERAERRHAHYVTNAVDLFPGVVFAMRHPRADLDERPLLCTGLDLEGELQGEWFMAGTATPADQPYRPAQRTPRPSIDGVQSAIVVGPPGQEIHTDEIGRVRVQFHWDREGAYDDDSSCWMRVSQGWAGPGFGLLTVPRAGQEVLVQFEGGDPDRPLVVGRVLNATAMAPYALPEHKTKSVWRSASSPGAAGFNELSFEDAAGRERIYLQAERDLAELVKRDETHLTRGNRQATVEQDCDIVLGADKRERVEQSRHLHVLGDRAERFDRTQSRIVGRELHVRVEGRDALEAGTEIHLRAGVKLVLEAPQGVSIAGPGGFVTVGPEGVSVVGKLIKINDGGAPGRGGGAQPVAPARAREAVVREPGAAGSVLQLAPQRAVPASPARTAGAAAAGRLPGSGA